MRMKRILVNFLLLIVVLVVSQAQDISRYEYWLDDNHSERYLVNSSDKDIAFNISTVSLSEGVHSLNFRAYRRDGVWGDFNRYLFYIASSSRSVGEITEYEYWIDNATNKVIGTDIKSDYDFNVDVSNLTNGKHIFCFRVKNTSGEWSNIYFEEFEIKNGVQPILPSLTISSNGNGAVTYNGTSVRNQSSSFTIEEGANAEISFVPDNGYRIKSLKVNGEDVTSSVSNNSYTVSNIRANTTVEVEFEAIPINSYTLKYVVDGVTYQTYQIQEGATITPEAKPTKEGYTFSGWSEIPQTMPSMDVTVTGSFIVNKYKLTYQVDGVEYKSYDVEYGATITPEAFPTKDGYTFSGWSEIPKIMPAKDVTVVGTFTKDEPVINTYTLTLTASGNGSATFNNTTAKNDLKTFTLNEGTSATIAFTPDSGYRIKSVKVNSVDVTSNVSNNSYTVSNIKDNTTVNVEFEAIPTTDTTPISGDKFEVDGITYVVNNDVNTVSVTSGNAKYSGDVAIPSSVVYLGNTYSVTSIGSWAFAFCDELTSVTIPNSVTSIDMDAFQECSLTSITIPNSVTDIRFEAFRNCGLTSVTIPSSVRSIGYGAFFGCDLTTITSEIENPFEIEEVFSSDAQLIVPKGTKAAYQATVGWNQFSNIVEAGDDSTISGQCGENVYYSYDNKTHTLTISGEGGMMYMFFSEDYPWWSFHDDIQHIVIESGVTSIGQEAFWGCSGLTSITLPESLTQSNEKAFSNCKSLEAVYISDLEAYLKINFFHDDNSNPLYYAHHLFLNGKEIIDLVIPDGITHINQYAFVNGSSIKTVYVPNSVTSIGERAFVGCSALTSVTIPSSVTSIGECAFSGNNITSMEVESGNKIYDSRDNCNAIIETASNTLINGCKTSSIPNNVTSIGSSAFNGCGGLTSITIPNSVTSIGDHAFYGCSGLTSVVSEIEDPFAIDVYVFNGIPSDAQLIVPKGTKAKYHATVGWNKFTNIVEAGEEPDLSGQIHINDIIYKVTGTGEVEVVSAENGVTSITIPSSVSYNNTVYKVTSIAKDAFENCDHLSAVIWEPDAQFNAKVNNPNFLLYVSDEKYASRSVKNVVVNGVAESIELTDAANGNDFYCPRVFSARNIVYSHNYQMETGIGDSRGWETIVLPFDVQKYTHATKGELESFTTWSKGSSKKPFWLFELTASGYKDVAGIKANTPYIISMPSNQQYEQQYQISGIVTFSASNVEVQKSDNLKPGSYQGRSLVPNYTNKDGGECLALNVNNYYVTNPGKDISGSKFVRGLRAVHPFEAYMTATDNTRSIDVMDVLTTVIRGILMTAESRDIIKVYDTKGVLVKTVKAHDNLRSGLAAGIYIVNGKKMIVK